MEAEIKKILQNSKHLKACPSPFLAHRIIAQWESRKNSRKWLRFWQQAAFLFPMLAAVVTWFAISSFTQTSYLATANRPFVVRIELQELSKQNIAFARVELPEGVHFYSERFPAVRQRRKLEFSWRQNSTEDHFPFVIQSSVIGRKKVMVRFFNKNDELLQKRIIEIDFNQNKKVRS